MATHLKNICIDKANDFQYWCSELWDSAKDFGYRIPHIVKDFFLELTHKDKKYTDSYGYEVMNDVHPRNGKPMYWSGLGYDRVMELYYRDLLFRFVADDNGVTLEEYVSCLK